jgi:hypothetical protein
LFLMWLKHFQQNTDWNETYKFTSLDFTCSVKGKGKDTANRAETWTGPVSSRRLKLPDFIAHEGGKVVGFTYRPPLPPRWQSW